jgi:hypothetical protein
VREPRLRERVILEFLRDLRECVAHANVTSQKICAFNRRRVRSSLAKAMAVATALSCGIDICCTALTGALIFLILVVAAI